MDLEGIEPEFMWKTAGSGGGGCPALYRVPALDGYIAQGKKLSPEAKAKLRQLLDDEDAVFLPADVLDRLREQA